MEVVPNLPSRLHMLGIGGAGLSGAARLLAARGHSISGHDRAPSPFLDGLDELGIAVELGASDAAFVPKHVGAVVRSAAVPQDDPQVAEARRRGVPVLKYAEILPKLVQADRLLAVAGTHGKTTTSWLLERALRGAANEWGALPGALVGGTDLAHDTNAIAPAKNGWFALEACEYDRSFLHLAPRGAIVTNVEADHLDCYGDLDGVVAGFARFVRGVHPDGLLVLGADVPAAVEHAARCAVWRLGREVQLDVRSMERGRARFDVVGPGFAVRDVRLAVPGRFNAGNAALAAALALGVMPFHRRASAAQDVAHALGEFRGVARRFETWGTFGDVELVHDYAHHPTELAATFDAARGAFEDRELCVLFQPHQHSRTSHFIGEFAKELAKVDRVVVTEVYGARAHIDGEHFAGSEDLVRLVRALGVEAEFVPELGEATRRFAEILPERAAALVLGAGDVENVRDDLSGLLSVRTQAASAAR